MFHIEFSHGLGGIWLRPDEYGKTRIVLRNVWNMFIQPFYNRYFWTLDFIDINSIVFFSYFIALYYLFTGCYHHLRALR